MDECEGRDDLEAFARWLLEQEMKLAPAMLEDETLGPAFSWVNHIRHEFESEFLSDDPRHCKHCKCRNCRI